MAGWLNLIGQHNEPQHSREGRHKLVYGNPFNRSNELKDTKVGSASREPLNLGISQPRGGAAHHPTLRSG
jgi:hypothetical protein